MHRLLSLSAYYSGMNSKFLNLVFGLGGAIAVWYGIEFAFHSRFAAVKMLKIETVHEPVMIACEDKFKSDEIKAYDRNADHLVCACISKHLLAEDEADTHMTIVSNLPDQSERAAELIKTCNDGKRLGSQFLRSLIAEMQPLEASEPKTSQ